MRQLLGRAAALHALALTLAACGGAPAATAPPPSATPAPLAATVAPSATPAPLAATIAPSATPAPLAVPRQGTAAALGITLIPATEPALATPVRPAVTPAAGATGGTHIQQAVADLAIRLSVDPGTVKVLRAEEVDWPDGSLGCPRDDMSYTQAIVNGVFVQLEAGGQQYNYHGRAGDAPFLCTSKRALLPEDLPPELRGGGGEGT